MLRVKALELLKEHYDNPLFNVKIGMGAPQIENVCFDEALVEFDRCARFRDPELLEYVYIYISDFVGEGLGTQLNEALIEFDLGLFKQNKGVTK